MESISNLYWIGIVTKAAWNAVRHVARYASFTSSYGRDLVRLAIRFLLSFDIVLVLMKEAPQSNS